MENIMMELTCWECGDHVGWMTGSDLHGLVYCDECYEKEQTETETETETDGI